MRVEMTREEALEFRNRWKFVNDFQAEEVRVTKPEMRFQQLRTMIATAHRLKRPDSSDSESATWERWRLIKERLHA